MIFNKKKLTLLTRMNVTLDKGDLAIIKADLDKTKQILADTGTYSQVMDIVKKL